jgi:hypothetical protein
LNAENRVVCRYLRDLTSAKALDILLPMLDGDLDQRSRFFKVYWHRSWAKSEQRRMLQRLIGPRPFRSIGGYENLLKVTSIGRFLHFANADLPTDSGEIGLLLYNGVTALTRRAKTEREKRLVRSFKDKLDQLYVTAQ